MPDSRANTDRGRRVAVVTGATAGIGFATAVGLAERGYDAVITGRDRERGRRSAEVLRARTGNDRIHFLQAEHSTVGGNHQAARALVKQFPRLDVLVNNAGGIYSDRWETADGYEGTLAMNFVGPSALTSELLPLLHASGGHCVNIVSSAFAMFRGDPFRDLHSREKFVGMETYARAKLLNVLWAQALAAREPTLAVRLVNPGMAWTPNTQLLERKAVPQWRLFWPLVRWFQRRASPESAARAPIHVASTELEATSGTYFNEKGEPEPLPRAATEAIAIARAWQLAEELSANAPTATADRNPHTRRDDNTTPGG